MAGMVRFFSEFTEKQWPFAGGKGGTLARLYQAGYPVPDGFVVLPEGFVGEELKPEAWAEVQTHLALMRKGNESTSFAVRSSALSEDSAQVSFAGEFETVLDVHTDEAIRTAICTVRLSRQSERVRVYSQAQGVDAAHDMAVVIQQLVRADISGVLFTADPVTGSHTSMIGNFVHGLGDDLVSGEVEPYSFKLERPKGRYHGSPELQRFARRLYRLASRLEEELGCPQDIEWAIAEGKLYLLQARPITTLQGQNPATGEWNDSLRGDYLWSNANLSEAVPDVMTPFTWSVWKIFYTESAITLGNHPLAGNICGRPYANLCVGISVYMAMGKTYQEALKELGESAGRVPEGIEVPHLPYTRLAVLRTLIPSVAYRLKMARKLVKEIPGFLATSPEKCGSLRQQIQQTRTKAELAPLWHDIVLPYYRQVFWILRVATKLSFSVSTPLHHELVEMVGEADANALLSNLSGDSELASLGPMLGVARVARGEMSREEYLERYGHRGLHECELMMPCPAEDPKWLEQQLEEYARNPFDVDELLDRQRAAFEAAWIRFQECYPRKARSVKQQIEQAGTAARRREAVRSEVTRTTWVIRAFALRAGELTGLGDGVFFLSIDELLDVLSGDDTIKDCIPVRREMYARYSALPPYPTIIRGRFDPFEWATDPDRRSDVFDARASVPIPDLEIITGYAGAAGRVEGVVRRLDSPAEGDQLQPGEILVAVTTNIGWTPLFPRAAAIITDVGAPLSHAAIVARELGIPAVVGCGDATMRLQTGARVRVDGGQGVVEVLETA